MISRILPSFVERGCEREYSARPPGVFIGRGHDNLTPVTHRFPIPDNIKRETAMASTRGFIVLQRN